MRELDELITVLEATLPAAPSSTRNIKLAAELEKDMQVYFKQLEDAISIEKLEKIYNKYVTE